ncbi:MAG: M20/M25/M40 family metallo-hydrolase [Pseudomonadales bacterium]|nr:M20/M25/M40 family metallo-hydrolase [Pseudomonadales bacterium]
MRPTFISVALVALSFHTACAQAELSATEQQIAKYARESGDDAIALLEQVVNINSGTMNFEGVHKVGDVFAEHLDELGFKTTWHDMGEVNRAGHLFAENAGGGNCELLIGHLDTVFEADSPFQRFTRNSNMAAGPGVNDMKGGDVVILFALKALAQAGVLDDGKFIVALIGDEEKSGSPKSISRRHLVDAAKRCDVALGFEIATSLGAATVARRGSSGWTLEVTGKRAHSSGIFSDEVGAGAVFETARILDRFYNEVRGEQYLTFNPGLILGGTAVEHDPEKNRGSAFGKTNVVAQRVVVDGGLRTISTEQESSARDKMRAITESGNLPMTSAKITFEDGYPSMPPTPGNMQLLDTLSQVSQDLGYGPVEAFDPGKRGAADVSFVAAYVDVLDGLGAEGNGAHTPDETIDLSTLPMLIQRAAVLMYRLM